MYVCNAYVPCQAVSNRTADVMRRQYFILLSLRLFHIFMSKSPIRNFQTTFFLFIHILYGALAFFHILLVTIGYLL